MKIASSRTFICLFVMIAFISLSCVSTQKGDDDATVIDADLMKRTIRRQLITALKDEIKQNTDNIRLSTQKHLAIIALGQEEPSVFRQDIILSIRVVNSVLSGLLYKVISLPENGYVGQEYTEPLVIQVLSGGHPLQNVSILTQEIIQTADKNQIATQYSLTSDESGLLRINLSRPQATGTHRIIVGIDPEYFLKPVFPENTEIVNVKLNDATKNQFATVIANEDTLVRVAVTSRAKQYSMDVYVQDTDISNAVIQGGNTGAGIVQSLSEEGFSISVLSIPEETERLTLAQALNLSNSDRIAFGEASILQFEESAGGYSVELDAIVRVYDRTTGSILLTVERTQRSSGTNSSSTVVAAFRVLGTKIAEEIARGLP